MAVEKSRVKELVRVSASAYVLRPNTVSTRYLHRIESRMYGVEIGQAPPLQRDVKLRVKLDIRDLSEADKVTEWVT